MDSVIKILIADDHRLFRSGIISLLNDSPGIKIVDEAENGEELYQKYFQVKPDIILSDISMPLLSGTEAIQKIKTVDDSVKVLFLSMYDSDEFIYYTFKAGGLGLVSKNIIKHELIEAIETVSRGERFFGRNLNEEKLSELITRFDSILSPQLNLNNIWLSPREIQTLKFISDGMTSREIADKLQLSKRTIDTHRAHLMAKLSLKTLPELIKFAIQFSFKEQLAEKNDK